MKSPFGQLLVRWMILALGVVIAAHVVPGIHYTDPVALFLAVVLLSFFNAILRPILILFTFPFILVTMGLGIVVINAFLFLIVGRIVDGFVVMGFWPALWGSLVLSITNLFMSGFMRARVVLPPKPPKGPPGGGDVIDI
ncbi:MAG TPA: phage holin family protein [Opitutaceae bacterium]